MGAMIVPSSILPKNQSRSDSRTSYIDDAIDRPNLHLATEQTATRIHIERTDSSIALPPFGKLMRASGVEVCLSCTRCRNPADKREQFAATADGVSRNITCSKEVILAAGAIKSPVLLQVSGIGPAPILSSINVSVQIDLPGVGMNLQDHGMVGAFYNCKSCLGCSPAPVAIRSLTKTKPK
jgi:choline dehydrogenase-like flavoprotein